MLDAGSSILENPDQASSIQYQASSIENLVSCNSMNHFEYIVIGCGSMGIATCSFLAARGHHILGIDQFNVPHEAGSHAGQSRIIRKAYFEHPDYVPLLERSYELWKDFEDSTDKQFYYETGIVYFGDVNHPTMKGIRRSSELYDVPVDTLTSKIST